MIDLSLEDAPDAGLDTVRRNAPLVIGEQRLPANTDPVIGKPWPVHNATIADLKQGRLADAPRVAWQYPIYSTPGRVIAVAELSAPDMRWAALHSATCGQDVVTATVALSTLLKDATGTFAFRLLRIPSASVLLLWLHGTDDNFVPLDLGPSLDAPHRVMSQAEVLDRVRPRLAERLSATGNRGA